MRTHGRVYRTVNEPGRPRTSRLYAVESPTLPTASRPGLADQLRARRDDRAARGDDRRSRQRGSRASPGRCAMPIRQGGASGLQNLAAYQAQAQRAAAREKFRRSSVEGAVQSATSRSPTVTLLIRISETCGADAGQASPAGEDAGRGRGDRAVISTWARADTGDEPDRSSSRSNMLAANSAPVRAARAVRQVLERTNSRSTPGVDYIEDDSSVSRRVSSRRCAGRLSTSTARPGACAAWMPALSSGPAVFAARPAPALRWRHGGRPRVRVRFRVLLSPRSARYTWRGPRRRWSATRESGAVVVLASHALIREPRVPLARGARRLAHEIKNPPQPSSQCEGCDALGRAASTVHRPRGTIVSTEVEALKGWWMVAQFAGCAGRECSGR